MFNRLQRESKSDRDLGVLAIATENPRKTCAGFDWLSQWMRTWESCNGYRARPAEAETRLSLRLLVMWFLRFFHPPVF
ncbi:hypothetical protein MPNT_10017 [Candidatus Methylacidithermus pantelleriae]|uniref:Uncharacterized protein n=1 Tax=Candidatus Methylacidithermus pantelleriae TaxID=2744239 RepID=A0A8J2FUS3_9BACT|nr:hypothetical protein MPNT_10017 [Candidatus Methylacidithermus pantelleriae]